MKPFERKYSVAEEIANAITHGIGALLSIVGLVVLVVAAASYGDPRRVVSAAVYGTSLVILYLSSTLYHSLPNSRAKHIFKILDHSSVFVLIVGTYVPITLVSLRGGWGWTLFGMVSAIGVFGIVLKVRLGDSRGFIFGLIYLAMGWLVVIALKPLIAALDPAGFRLIVYGGLAYTAGVIVYSIDRILWNHVLWHIFVLTGSVLHYFAILFYVVGTSSPAG